MGKLEEQRSRSKGTLEKAEGKTFSLGRSKISESESSFFSTQNLLFSIPMSGSKPRRSKDDRRRVHTNNNRTGQK
jgi:hypothetical protein